MESSPQGRANSLVSKVDDAGFAKQIKAECKTLRTSIIQEADSGGHDAKQVPMRAKTTLFASARNPRADSGGAVDCISIILPLTPLPNGVRGKTKCTFLSIQAVMLKRQAFVSALIFPY